jgi:predicted dehydrogenase
MKRKIGIIGCGNICDIYISNIKNRFDNLELVALSNRNIKRAQEKALAYNIEKVETIDEMIKDSSIDIILILTSPSSHYKLIKEALLNNHHVYVEKPLALNLKDGRELLNIAKDKNLLLGVAPDTVLGGGIQQCKKIINNGTIGKVVSVNAFFANHGPENWHPSPEFLYQKGGGPMLDMAPYYLSAIINMVGPVEDVIAMCSKAFNTRTIGSGPNINELIKVEVPTHYSGSLRFKNNAIGTLIMSFDVFNTSLPRIEIHGTEGSLSIPDPNTFSGKIILSINDKEPKEVEIDDKTYIENSRGLGLSDLASKIDSKEELLASSQLALHVLEIMLAFEKSNNTGSIVHLDSTCNKLPLL